ncbi:MAG TPA: ArsI/CadI family heavy metal resistance metalloenzyme [Oligoflexia bacterium]|nr:ArsI/CadI family heavy metal resistance metalloenzyme [Oligoflexia bacterium]
MKRFHIHVGVRDLEESVRFYSTLFGQQPSKRKDDYAKWMLDDPRLNFAISTRIGGTGVDHLGIQVENPGELSEIAERLKNADLSVHDEGETTCCYSKSNKSWVEDPSGVAWEAYQNLADAEIYREAPKTGEANEKTGCCVAEESSCC